MKCTHDNVTFIGLYSLIGNYHCNDCGEKIEPVKYHQMKKMPHVRLDENNQIISKEIKKNPQTLDNAKVQWRNR